MLSIALVFNSCNKDEDDDAQPGTQKTKVSEWNGTFTGNVENGTLQFTLYSDNSIILSWDTPNACCNSSTGTYTLNGSNFSFTIGGSASSGTESSTFTMSSTGLLNVSSGSGTYTIDFTGQGWEDQSGSWNVNTPGAQFATVTIVLNMPADAEGKMGLIAIDNDLDVDNGIVSIQTGPCPAGTYFTIPFDDIPAGTYFIVAAVWIVGEFGDDLGPGDYIGVYGGSYPNNLPGQPNAVVPASGSKTFNIDLFVLTDKSDPAIYSPTMGDIEILTPYFDGIIK
jgi:hypothetical protein